MDMNYLLSRHQISLMRADDTGSIEARASHRGLADGYAESIRAEQGRVGGGRLVAGDEPSGGGLLDGVSPHE